MRSALGILGLGLALAAGCAPLPPPRTLPPRPVAARDTARAATPTPRPVAAAVDSAPSSDALAILETIPDPVPPGQRVPPAAPAGSDTARARPAEPSPADSDAGPSDVPVPTPTPVLGEKANVELQRALAAPDSAAGSPADSASRVTPPVATPAPARPRPAPADTAAAPCWRVQIGAPETSDEAEQKRAAGQSLLLVPMVIEREGGLYKVRTRDCLDRASADRIRERAEASGFRGAFPVEGARR